jgi:hypothetical protein
MPQDDYKRSLELAKGELAVLETERNTLTERISEIDLHVKEVIEGIKGLARLCDQQATKSLLYGNPLPLAREKGLNNAVEFALKTSRKPLTPVQVRERLQRLGFDIDKYKSDFLATLHTVLKRLHARRKVDAVPVVDGKTAYKWISESEIAEELVRGSESSKD